jgi:hypothetical protein
MHSCKVILTIVGMALEVSGGLLAAWPQLTAPSVLRFRASARRRASGLERFVRRLFRRQRHYTASVEPGGYKVSGHPVSGIVSPPEDADPERMLAFLRERAMESQERLNRLERKVAAHPGQWHTEVQAARSALEAQMAADREQARDLFIGRRLVGVGCIAAGGVVLGIAGLL